MKEHIKDLYFKKMKSGKIIRYKERPCIENSKRKLKNYQKRVVERMISQNGLLVVHGTGAGKTLSGVTVSQCLLELGHIKRVIVATPRALVPNFLKELETYGVKDRTHYYVNTYLKTIKLLKNNPRLCSGALLIVDEAHNLRTQVSFKKGSKKKEPISGIMAYNYIMFAKKCAKVLLLTATPLVNHPRECNNLIQMINQTGKILSHKMFEEHTFRWTLKRQITPTVVLKSNETKNNRVKETLWGLGIRSNEKQMVKDKIDFYTREKVSEDYPSVKINDIKITMKRAYYVEYRRIELNQIKNFSQLKTIDLEGKASNSFYMHLRKYTNAIECDGYKIDWIVKRIQSNKKEQKKTLLYSQFLGTGLNLIGKKLKELNIPFEMITGKTNQKKVKPILNQYNNNYGGVLFISRAGGEGLDLKGVREVILMEPFWNKSSEEQVIGRAVRYRSHVHLPVEERNVVINRLFLVKPKNPVTLLYYQLRYLAESDKNPSVDTYLRLLGIAKQRRIDQFLELAKKANRVKLKEV